ncbi:hypothetical protein HB901_12505, partial [Listeria booriae]|uniref:hypothetical protein n=1 Tax=Listeria booriae TaxID=1552123 RepID=UPI00162A17D4
MEDTLKILLPYIPITVLASVLTAVIRWALFHVLADKLEKHLQGPTRRFISYHFPTIAIATIIFIILMLFNLSQNGLSIKVIIDNYKDENIKAINSLIIMFILLYGAVIFAVNTVMWFFKKDIKRLWYIVGDNSRIYIYKKSFNNKYISYVVPTDKPQKITRTFLSPEDICYPVEVVYNEDAKNNLKQLWDFVPSSKNHDIKMLNRTFNMYIVL